MKILLAIAMLLMFSATSLAAEIIFDHANLKNGGPGCNTSGTVRWTDSNNSITIEFNTLGLNLSRDNARLTMLQHCRVTVPAQLPERYFPSFVSETISAPLFKTDNSTATLSARTWFLSRSLSNFQSSVPADLSGFAPFTRSQRTDLNLRQEFCNEQNRADRSGVFVALLSLGGSRNRSSETIQIPIPGKHLVWKLTVELARCN